MAGKKLADIGIIGGSGLYAIKELSNKKEIKIKTPFGKPSDAIILGTIAGVKCAFLPRHGRKHAILPTEIPQKANMWALKSIGVKTIISVSAVGSLKQSLPPTHFVFPDQFVDETRHRCSTFFGDGIVGHVPMAEPFCMDISKLMFKESKKMKIKSHFGGTYVCMEGPGFSTKAESFYHRKCGYSIIGMTMATEAKLAREAGFCYAPVSLVTDYDCWKEDDTVDQEKVTRTLRLNIENIKKLLVRVIPQIGKMKRKENCCNFTKGSVLTAKKDIPAKLYNKLKLIIE